MKKILFQGDSITDSGRVKEEPVGVSVYSSMGIGYPSKVVGALNIDSPGEYEFVNKGIGGNRVVDLYARIKVDIINLKPDYLSIMIGVNDVWHEIASDNGVAAEKYEKIYDMLLSEIIEALPNVKIMLLEPYLLQGSGTTGELRCGGDKYSYFREDVEKRAEITKKLADKYNLVFVPLQAEFDRLVEIQPSEYWLFDGVHPTNNGHEIIAREWLKGFAKLK